MKSALRRVLWISGISVLLPLVFIIGWRLEIDALFSWPSWLFYLWPSAIMFTSWQIDESKFAFFLILAGSLGLNALLWVIVGLPLLWLFVDLPRRLEKSH